MSLRDLFSLIKGVYIGIRQERHRCPAILDHRLNVIRCDLRTGHQGPHKHATKALDYLWQS